MTVHLALRQPSFPDFCPVTAAVELLATESTAAARGAIYTRSEVVDFILDLVGYRTDRPLHELKLLEPSCGAGDFLLPAVGRLLTAWKAAGRTESPLESLGECIRAVELHRDTFSRTQAALVACLISYGMGPHDAAALTNLWLQNGDFLLADLAGEFDVVVGNPPYVRQEQIPDVLIAEYRSRFTTVFDRADLYIPFIERSLRLLSGGGVLGFICADRWMKNRYGGPLRALVARDFHLKVHVDMTDTQAFLADVIAYPAVTVITREECGPTRVAHRPALDSATLAQLAVDLLSAHLPSDACGVRELSCVAVGSQPWVLDSSGQVSLLRRMEAQFPPLEDVGCKVGIGVATGADQAFIGKFDELDVEDDRKQPLVMTRDISSGVVAWRGYGVINPFAESGGLVDLALYPRLKRYLELRKDQIASRHCALKTPAAWYRTIDRITPALTKRPKLLVPDIKGQAHVVYEGGALYPHHNLYFITSDDWDLRALQAVLLSRIARLFVATYSTRMRGGYIRFQAQYLRRIRVPRWMDVPPSMRTELAAAAVALDLDACNHAANRLYQLTPAELVCLEEDV